MKKHLLPISDASLQALRGALSVAKLQSTNNGIMLETYKTAEQEISDYLQDLNQRAYKRLGTDQYPCPNCKIGTLVADINNIGGVTIPILACAGSEAKAPCGWFG